VAQNQPSITSDVLHALMTEYDACFKAWDHYDSVEWTIGSIFIASSLFLLAVSFEVPPTKISFVAVVSLCVVSLMLFGIWYAYVLHVEPYIKDSWNRAIQIETWINQQYGAVWLQLESRYLSKHNRGRGRAITYSLFGLILATAVARIIILFVYGQ
jgi:hypothetical protein